MSEEGSNVSKNTSSMSELDKQLEQWQSAYKEATPSVDTDSLIKDKSSGERKR